jgi:hypothetical protein
LTVREMAAMGGNARAKGAQARWGDKKTDKKADK